jgi:hypothetical protein
MTLWPGRGAALALACALAGCGGGGRDVVPEMHDVRVGTDSPGAYVHVARRPLGFVALARETGLGPELGASVSEHLADSLDACATSLAAKGKLVEGTVRVDVSVSGDGSVVVSHVTIAPGDGVAANALLCVIAPLKLMALPGASAKGADAARTFTLDASWGPHPNGAR